MREHSLQPLACRQHDHQACIDDAITNARELCCKRGVKLTRLRESVLSLIWSSHKPLGAYTLMEMLAAQQTRRVAPPTVYRALGFLQEQHFIHKIHSLNAYVGCCEPNRLHQGHFLICNECGIAVETSAKTIDSALEQAAATAGFSTQQQTVEILGWCSQCQSESNSEAQPPSS